MMEVRLAERSVGIQEGMESDEGVAVESCGNRRQ